jgi:integrase
MAGVTAMKVTMTSRVRAYLAQRRALGFKLKSEGLLLLDFARFADKCHRLGPIDLKLTLRWATKPKSCDRLYHARRLEIVRTFAKHLAVEEPRTVVPPRHLLGPAHRRAEPYIYSNRQIQQLMRNAGDLGGLLRRHTTRTLIGLLASTGLRISEALKLQKGDVDLDTGVITVRESKYRKTRFVPLHRTTVRPLQAYTRRRDELWPLADSFFVSVRGTRWSCSAARGAFNQIRQGLLFTRRAPRLHDLRHTFTCRVLLRWQRTSVGAVGRVPILSRYLGHTHVTDTFWYLTGIPELLAEAAKRSERLSR